MNEILVYLISISGVSTIAIWLGKLVIGKSFDIGIEKYKNTLAKEIEEYKNKLSILSLEHQVKFTKLHDERAEKIKSLYSQIVEIEKALIFSTTIAQGPEFVTDTVRDEVAIEKLRELISKLDHDRIFFSIDTLEKFDSIIKESWEIIFQMMKVRRTASDGERKIKIGREPSQAYYNQTDLWGNADDRTQKEFRILKEELANEFRGLLGI
jgi:hypothetical protein